MPNEKRASLAVVGVWASLIVAVGAIDASAASRMKCDASNYKAAGKLTKALVRCNSRAFSEAELATCRDAAERAFKFDVYQASQNYASCSIASNGASAIDLVKDHLANQHILISSGSSRCGRRQAEAVAGYVTSVLRAEGTYLPGDRRSALARVRLRKRAMLRDELAVARRYSDCATETSDAAIEGFAENFASDVGLAVSGCGVAAPGEFDEFIQEPLAETYSAALASGYRTEEAVLCPSPVALRDGAPLRYAFARFVNPSGRQQLLLSTGGRARLVSTDNGDDVRVAQVLGGLHLYRDHAEVLGPAALTESARAAASATVDPETCEVGFLDYLECLAGNALYTDRCERAIDECLAIVSTGPFGSPGSQQCLAAIEECFATDCLDPTGASCVVPDPGVCGSSRGVCDGSRGCVPFLKNSEQSCAVDADVSGRGKLPRCSRVGSVDIAVNGVCKLDSSGRPGCSPERTTCLADERCGVPRDVPDPEAVCVPGCDLAGPGGGSCDEFVGEFRVVAPYYHFSSPEEDFAAHGCENCRWDAATYSGTVKVVLDVDDGESVGRGYARVMWDVDADGRGVEECVPHVRCDGVVVLPSPTAYCAHPNNTVFGPFVAYGPFANGNASINNVANIRDVLIPLSVAGGHASVAISGEFVATSKDYIHYPRAQVNYHEMKFVIDGASIEDDKLRITLNIGWENPFGNEAMLMTVFPGRSWCGWFERDFVDMGGAFPIDVELVKIAGGLE